MRDLLLFVATAVFCSMMFSCSPLVSHRDSQWCSISRIRGIIYLPFVCSFRHKMLFENKKIKNAYIGICYLLFILTKPFVWDYDMRRCFFFGKVADLHTHHRTFQQLGEYFPIDRRAKKPKNSRRKGLRMKFKINSNK